MRLPLALVAFLAASTIAACGSDSTAPSTSSNPSVQGSWTLKTVNGGGLPATLQAANPKVEVVDDQYSFNADGTYSEQGHIRTTQGAAVTTLAEVEIGVWTQTGNTIRTVATADGTVTSLVISGSSLTATQSGFTLVYGR